MKFSFYENDSKLLFERKSINDEFIIEIFDNDFKKTFQNHFDFYQNNIDEENHLFSIYRIE